MKKTLSIVTATVLLLTLALAVNAQVPADPLSGSYSKSPPIPADSRSPVFIDGPVIQLALLLDTSNSMDGLIDQAKTQLWKIVNEFIPMRKNGAQPVLHVALYEYGNSSLSHREGYIRQVLPFTDDLDRVSQELFALKTNGGDEYCGWVINASLDQLRWSTGKDALKTIFIAGNEPFTQGSVDYKTSCRAAASRGVTINTIFCGPYDEGVQTNWKEGALLADGSYMHIDQTLKVAHIESPQDADIIRLGEMLNQTYIPYGAAGSAGVENQAAQDRLAMEAAPSSMMQRSVTKSSSYYKASSWDLVDAVNDGDVELKDVPKEELPEPMRGMSDKQREEHLQQTLAERQKIQDDIKKLNDARNAYVAEKRKEMAETGEDTLDSAMIKAVREQAVRKGYVFE